MNRVDADTASPSTQTQSCTSRALCGWSPPALPADTAAKRWVDRVQPRTGVPIFAFYAAVIGLLNLAPHLTMRGSLAVDGLAALAAGGWCTANFWRCRHAHCMVSGVGWLVLALLAFAESVVGRSLIGGNEQVVFLAILGLALLFEAGWYLSHGTNAVRRVADSAA